LLNQHLQDNSDYAAKQDNNTTLRGAVLSFGANGWKSRTKLGGQHKIVCQTAMSIWRSF
jgi:hypothetical protein